MPEIKPDKPNLNDPYKPNFNPDRDRRLDNKRLVDELPKNPFDPKEDPNTEDFLSTSAREALEANQQYIDASKERRRQETEAHFEGKETAVEERRARQEEFARDTPKKVWLEPPSETARRQRDENLALSSAEREARRDESRIKLPSSAERASRKFEAALNNPRWKP